MHPVTYCLLTPSGSEKSQLDQVSQRKYLSELFLQPATVPIFREHCALTFESEKAFLAKTQLKSGVLLDVHVGLPPSGVPGGVQSLVDGSYGYYHYMQQNFNDKVKIFPLRCSSFVDTDLGYRDGVVLTDPCKLWHHG